MSPANRTLHERHTFLCERPPAGLYPVLAADARFRAPRVVRALASPPPPDLSIAPTDEVAAADPPTYVVVALALALVGLLAIALPARRAAGIDPMVALRHE